MLPCDKRQTVVKQDHISHRCISVDSEAYRQLVSEEICSVCPVRIVMNQARKCEPTTVRSQECKPKNESHLEEAIARKIDAKISPEDTPDGFVPDFPKASVQLWLYKEALKRWHAAGRPVRTDEEVKEILETKCKTCDWYDDGRCRGCGCRVTSGSIPVLNKIKMATESCPHPERKW